MSWSRTNSTLYCSSNALSSAKSSSSREASARLMFRSSAPMPAVSGTTSIAAVPTRREGHPSRSTVWSMTFMVASPGCDGGWGSGLEGEDGGADAAARLEVAVRLDGVVEGVALVDLDGDAAGDHVVEELSGQGRALRGVGDVVGQRGAGDEQRALDGQLHRLDRRDRAGGGPEADEQAAPAQGVQGRRDGRPADAVVGDRDAGAVGDLADPGRDVLAGVDDGVGA